MSTSNNAERTGAKSEAVQLGLSTAPDDRKHLTAWSSFREIPDNVLLPASSPHALRPSR
jgi:hypothetical protein